MLDFGALPPEVNSARMYAGPGSGSLMTAASAWNALAAELNAAALSYDKMITALSSEEWMGPASASMAQAVQPYVTWMTTTAAQAEQAATQAQAAAAAYETALAATVPPPLVAANRAQSMQLMSTNVLGQNTPADRAAGGPVRRDVGPGCDRDVQLCGSVGDGDQGDAVHPVTPDRQPVRAGHPGRCGHQRDGQQHGEQHAQSTLSKVVTSTPNALQGRGDASRFRPADPSLQ